MKTQMLTILQYFQGAIAFLILKFVKIGIDILGLPC